MTAHIEVESGLSLLETISMKVQQKGLELLRWANFLLLGNGNCNFSRESLLGHPVMWVNVSLMWHYIPVSIYQALV